MPGADAADRARQGGRGGAAGAPAGAFASAGQAGAAAHETEAALAALWCEALGLDEVGIRDHFLDLGGHSLMAARLAMRVRDRFGVEVPVRAVFDTPTVEGMAEYIEEVRMGRPEPPGA